ncbi:MAG: PH domain-containing protein [Anaerolineaceae bacterium]
MKKGYIDSFLGEKEKILLVAHQHWFLLFWSIIFEIAVILLLIAAVTILSAMVNPLLGLGYLLLIIPLVSLVKDILIFYNRQFIVTNRRVIEISGVFNKNVTDSSLEKVNDVKMVQSFLGRIFDYGNIQILTASELGANEFRYIENPIKFKTAMLNAKERMPMDEAMNFQAPVEKSIPQLINELDQLRHKGIVTEEEFAEKKKELLAKM